MFKWAVWFFIILVGLTMASGLAASEHKFSQANDNKQQNNSRFFGQTVKGGDGSLPRMFGDTHTTRIPGTTFSAQNINQPKNIATMFPAPPLESSGDANFPTEQQRATAFHVEEPAVQVAGLSSLNQPSQSSNHEPAINVTESFLSDPARVGGLVGGITFGAVLIHPLAPILGNVLGYLVGKTSDYSEREKNTLQEQPTVRPIVTNTDSVQVIRLSNN